MFLFVRRSACATRGAGRPGSQTIKRHVRCLNTNKYELIVKITHSIFETPGVFSPAKSSHQFSKRAVTFTPMPMPKTLCRTILSNKTAQQEICRTCSGRGMGLPAWVAAGMGGRGCAVPDRAEQLRLLAHEGRLGLAGYKSYMRNLLGWLRLGWRRGHVNLLCIVPMLTNDPRRESADPMSVVHSRLVRLLFCLALCGPRGLCFCYFANALLFLPGVSPPAASQE